MIDTLYIEHAVADHPRTQAILARYPKARKIYCDRYNEVFNRRSQNFRLQKNRPALMLAAKQGATVLPTPPGYGIGGENNYYFSHMLNCVYDCRYCFLQGMYRSANYVLFVNYEDFFAGMDTILAQHAPEPCWFFSGYDCDSLALEPVTGFVEETLTYLRTRSLARLELRTKSTQVRSLLRADPVQNCIVAFSLNPEPVVRALEHRTPSLLKRLEALAALQDAGWPVGLRFDPVIYSEDFQDSYSAFFRQVFEAIDPSRIHSVSLGAFRLPRDFFGKLVKLYPREKLLAAGLEERDRMVAYQAELEAGMLAFCRDELARYIDGTLMFQCGYEEDAVA